MNEFNALPSDADRFGLQATPNLQAWVRGFLNRYVDGLPHPALIRDAGFAMDPPFKRLWAPRQAIVELRTLHTRTFGFFATDRSFVADRIVLTETVKTGRRANQAAIEAIADGMLTGWMRRLAPTEIDGTSDVEQIL